MAGTWLLTDHVRHKLVLSPSPGVMLSTQPALSCLSLAQPDRAGGQGGQAESMRGAAPGCLLILREAGLAQPSAKLHPSLRRKSCQGKPEDGSGVMGLASPAAQAQHPAQKLLLLPNTCATQGMFCCCQFSLPCSVMDTKICSGEGEVAAGILRGL